MIIEATVAAGGGARLHVHADLDDSFYLVSGPLALRCGEQAFAVEPGRVRRPAARRPAHLPRQRATSLAVMLQVHADDSFLRFVRGGRASPRPAVPCPRAWSWPPGMDAALEVAARTGQPVIGPPMGEAEAAEVTA